ncbi:hypothetical protein D3C80_1748340 [compost metagenome]
MRRRVNLVIIEDVDLTLNFIEILPHCERDLNLFLYFFYVIYRVKRGSNVSSNLFLDHFLVEKIVGENHNFGSGTDGFRIDQQVGCKLSAAKYQLNEPGKFLDDPSQIIICNGCFRNIFKKWFDIGREDIL